MTRQKLKIHTLKRLIEVLTCHTSTNNQRHFSLARSLDGQIFYVCCYVDSAYTAHCTHNWNIVTIFTWPSHPSFCVCLYSIWTAELSHLLCFQIVRTTYGKHKWVNRISLCRFDVTHTPIARSSTLNWMEEKDKKALN